MVDLFTDEFLQWLLWRVEKAKFEEYDSKVFHIVSDSMIVVRYLVQFLYSFYFYPYLQAQHDQISAVKGFKPLNIETALNSLYAHSDLLHDCGQFDQNNNSFSSQIYLKMYLLIHYVSLCC